jgi:hypothetical protein
MSKKLVPLRSGPGSTPAAPGNLIPLPESEEEGQSPVPIASKPAGPGSTLESAPPATAARTAPTVSFKRDGQRVTQIEIRCSCGEVIQLDCDYDGG